LSAVPVLAGAAMLLLGLLLPLRRRRAGAARLVAAQGGMLALAAAAAAWTGAGGPWLWALALGALAGRALVLPTLVRLATAGGQGVVPPATGEVPPPVAPGAAAARLLAGGVLAVLAVAAVVALGAGVEAGTREGLALALATLLAGLLAMALRRGAPSGLLGLLAAENGALLGLVHAGGGLPAAAVLAVLSPGLVACIALAFHGRGAGAVSDLLPWAARR
jgi:hydrogenase-4 component E